MLNSYDVIEIDNNAILNTLRNFHVREYFTFVHQFGLKTCQTYYRQNIYCQYYFENKILYVKILILVGK